MIEIFSFLETSEGWIYGVLGIICLFFLRKFIVAFQEWRSAAFGLERENAFRHLGTSLTIIVILSFLAIAEFSLVSFVSPAFPKTKRLATATIGVIVTPSLTLPENLTQPARTASLIVSNGENGCIPGKIEWISPKDGQEVQGILTLEGTVQVDNFGFYKYEVSPVGSDVWETLAANNAMQSNGELGVWNASVVTPGDYRLRLVVLDNQNTQFPPCYVNIRVISPP